MFARIAAFALIAPLYCLAPTTAQAQCNGQPAAGAICGNPTGAQALPRFAPPAAYGTPVVVPMTCDGIIDNSAALAAAATRAMAASGSLRLSADSTGGKACRFTSLTTINSPGATPSGNPPSLLITIDAEVTILFNGSTGWLKIDGGASQLFRRSGVIGGNISYDPTQSAGTGWALQLFRLNEAVVQGVSFFNYLTTAVQPSNGLLIDRVFSGDIIGNFFLNHLTRLRLQNTSNFIKACGNEFVGATIAVQTPSGSSNNANVICNNYFEQNLQHIVGGNSEADYQIYANYFNQGGCVFPCATMPGSDTDIVLSGNRGQFFNNELVNSFNTDSIEVLGVDVSVVNNRGRNNVGTASGGHSIHITASSIRAYVVGNNFTSPVQTGGLFLDQGTGTLTGVNFLSGSPVTTIPSGWLSAYTNSLLFSPDNTFDIGASGATRPRDVFIGRNAVIGGSSSGTLTVKSAAVASGTLTLPAGTTDFSATGGASQVVKQTSSGGAFTVARLACADLSDSSSGCTSAAGVTTTSPITGTTTIGCATCVTSAAALAPNQIVIGSGSQGEQTLGSLGSTTTLLHGNAAGAPTFGAVVSADMNITATSCTNQFVTAISTGAVGSCSTATLASAQFANQGTTTTVLHGNGAGNPSFSAVLNADLNTMATNTVKGNATSGTATPTDLAVGTCSTAASAIIWTTNTGFGCNTSITAAAMPASGLTGQVALANGGTNANLTASSGGVVYSGSTGLAILSGTATARQMLQSGSNSAPTWSTTTWPATTTINRLLWSSAANVISDLATANSSILVTDGSGVPSLSSTLPAHTLGGTVSGGGNQINNVVIGNSTPLAGSFTALSATTAFSVTTGTSSNISMTAGSGANINFGVAGFSSVYNMDANGFYPGNDNSFTLGKSGATWLGVWATLTSDAAATDTTVCNLSTGEFRKGSGTLGICLGTSGRQFKVNETPMQAGLYEVSRFKLLNYRYKLGYGDDGERLQYGMAAQDVEEVMPDLVRHGHDGQAINFDIGALLPVALKAIQELKADNDNLRACQQSWRCRIFGAR